MSQAATQFDCDDRYNSLSINKKKKVKKKLRNLHHGTVGQVRVQESLQQRLYCVWVTWSDGLHICDDCGRKIEDQ